MTIEEASMLLKIHWHFLIKDVFSPSKKFKCIRNRVSVDSEWPSLQIRRQVCLHPSMLLWPSPLLFYYSLPDNRQISFLHLDCLNQADNKLTKCCCEVKFDLEIASSWIDTVAVTSSNEQYQRTQGSLIANHYKACEHKISSKIYCTLGSQPKICYFTSCLTWKEFPCI